MEDKVLSDLWHYAVRKTLSPHEWTWTQAEQEEMAEGLILLLNERGEYARLRECESRMTGETITRAREAEKARDAAEARAEKAEKDLRRVMKNMGLGPDGRVFKEKKHD